jgi:thymidylate synthase (FAD)
MYEIVKPSAELIRPVLEETVLLNLEDAARTCYRSEHKVEPGSAKKLFDRLIDRGHLSPLEHEKMTVRIVCDRGVSHELVRHRLASYSQESTRYCNYGNDQFGKTIKVIAPVLENDNRGICGMTAWNRAMSAVATAYFNMLDCGLTPQIARSVLPNSLATTIVVTANIREWYHILDLRLSAAAHPDMRRVMALVLEELLKVYPFVFKRFIPDNL